MEDVIVIYHNSFGISFRWKQNICNITSGKLRIVFRDIGFYLFPEDVKLFADNIKLVKKTGSCHSCKNNSNCRTILLSTPSDKMDIAVNEEELKQIEDLIEGTLFHLDLETYLDGICKN